MTLLNTVILFDALDTLKLKPIGTLGNTNCLVVVSRVVSLMSTLKLLSQNQKRLRVAAPKMWNAVPLDICCLDSIDVFEKQLKTYLFKLAFF